VITDNSLKNPAKVALATMVVLLIGSIVYYRERMLFGDASFISFNIVNYRSLQIQEGRYGSFITQLWPYLGQKMGLSLNCILLGYSIAFNAFYLVVASVLYFAFKNYRLTILMALYYTLFISQSYYWTNNELHQAIGWMFLFFGTVIYMGQKKVTLPFLSVVFALLLFLAITTHFVVIIPLVFLWVCYILDKELWPFKLRDSIILSVLIALAVLLKYLDGANHAYETEHLAGVAHANIADGIQALSSPVVQMFLSRCVSNYWWGLIALLVGLVWLGWNKRFALLFWTIISVIGYAAIIGLTYGKNDADFPLFHIESEWAGISILAAAPLVFYFLPKVSSRIAVALLAAIFITRLLYIQSYAADFIWRIDFEKRVLAQMRSKGVHKLALYEEKPLRKRLILDWTLSQESLFLSTMSGDKPAYTFTLVNPDNKEALAWLSGKQNFHTVFGPLTPASLNARYFSIDTTTPYTVTSYEAFMK
jgi:hypothetical protein